MKNLQSHRLAVNQFSFATPLDERIRIDLLDSLFSPDVASPPGVPEKKLGEYRLWRAILEDALRICLLRSRASSTHITVPTIEAAERWVESEVEHPGSFVFVCAILGLAPDYVRGLLASARAARAA